MSAPTPESGIEALAILYEQAKSRLLAAEARVREVELESGSWRRVCERLEREAATLRADRDALVPLLRYFVEYVEDGEGEDGPPRHQCEFTLRPEKGYCEFHDKWGQARAILAREET